MQIVAFGSQDTWLTGAPEITYFRVAMKRYSLFAIEPILQTWNGTIGWSKRCTSVIARNGDLVSSAILELTFQKNSAYGTTFYPSEAFIKTLSFSIGGQSIDTHSSTWFRFYNEMFRSNDDKRAYQRMNDFVDGEADGTIKRMYLPLLFWWNRTIGLSLGLIGLQFHECRFDVQFAAANEVAGVDPAYVPTCDLWLDYVYLEGAERNLVSSRATEILIDQVQYPGDESITISNTSKKQNNIRLQLNHPCKVLILAATSGQHGVFTGGPVGTTAEAFAPISDITLQFNGNSRLATRKGSTWGQLFPYQACKALNTSGIYMWSPALDPASPQPSGTANFSRIDVATLQCVFKIATPGATAVHDILTPDDNTTAAATNLNLFRYMGWGYNILRQMGGMAGIAYSS